ncbi:hypothetical protein A3A40_01440 [Candidatus Kaiserbacteria bacterium RIFCSPLOWO2_01_FULL_54_20]|uniref:Uncharacterized protein n=1 Tax=Candidatus Kaiserbacteria bacterium RIFCSPLOWO2_01_FULL_54_20 TaxID=1798513 RepID=A0A1F6EJ17_9BACT|nr:MAG: hypothetical protein A3A40_01440 [Candidatus Kaiserbacteria bacterium RIFCSPLOWO2_01_FULL_54_20]
MRARIQKISKYAPSIFQGKLDLSSARRSFSLTVEHSAEPVLLRVLLAALALFACAYIYFVGATILNVIARKEAMAETASLTSAVSSLGREYFAASQGLGPDDGVRLGLSPVSNTVYLHRPGNAAAAATLESNEI